MASSSSSSSSSTAITPATTRRTSSSTHLFPINATLPPSSSSFLLLLLLLLLPCFLPLDQVQHVHADIFTTSPGAASSSTTPSAPQLPSPPVVGFAPPLNCTSECGRRCSEAGRQNVCLRACGTCCYRCSCVPPGTSGNHLACGPCYAQKTHNGRTKCP